MIFHSFSDCKWHINMHNTQCINNSICNCWSRTNSACFADTFHTKWVDGVDVTVLSSLESGKLRSQRHGIIHQCCRQQLAIFRVLDSLNHRLADTMRNTTVNLTFDKQRVELPSTVVNRDVTLISASPVSLSTSTIQICVPKG